MAGRIAEPPWLSDPEPRLWVPISIAARVYFRRSADVIRKRCVAGTLGLRSHFDGTRWFVRLPSESAARLS